MEKPLIIKFPIELEWGQARILLQIIIEKGCYGIIIGNLAKDRKNPVLFPDEVEQCGKGNFSGQATKLSSNQL